MIIDHRIQISLMCPACGNYYYGSGVRSYNTFGATVFSDGYIRACHNPFWLTRCPKCNQYFAKEHLFELPIPIDVIPENPYLPYKAKKLLENTEQFGRLDGYFSDEETKMDFIEKAIAQGQYYPINVHESEKAQFKLRLHKDLWHEYNMNRDKRSDEVYIKLCRDIIDMMEDKTMLTYEDRLTLAELYRNVGEFERCLIMLDGMNRNQNTVKFIDAISAEALKKNEKTVVVVEGNW